MKPVLRFITILLLNISIYSSAAAQRVEDRERLVSFPTIADYEYFADNPDSRGVIETLVNNSPTLITLSKYAANDQQDVIPEFLQLILNSDYIVAIGSFYVKIDFENGRGLVIRSSDPDAYEILVKNDLEAKGLMQFSMDDGNALEIMEQVEKDQLSVSNYKDHIVPADDLVITQTYSGQYSGPNTNAYGDTYNSWFFSCANPPGQELKRWPTWGTPGKASECPPPGTTRLAADLKLVYQKAVIYFSLQSKEKCREYCEFGGNPQTAGEVSVYMYLNGTVRYKRCGWSERADSRFSDFTYTSVKDWRPFESSRRLERYDFTVQFKQAQSLNSPHTFQLMNIRAGY